MLCKRQRHWETDTTYTLLHNSTRRHLILARFSQTQQQLKTPRGWGDRCKLDLLLRDLFTYLFYYRWGINDSAYIHAWHFTFLSYLSVGSLKHHDSPPPSLFLTKFYRVTFRTDRLTLLSGIQSANNDRNYSNTMLRKWYYDKSRAALIMLNLAHILILSHTFPPSHFRSFFPPRPRHPSFSLSSFSQLLKLTLTLSLSFHSFLPLQRGIRDIIRIDR